MIKILRFIYLIFFAYLGSYLVPVKVNADTINGLAFCMDGMYELFTFLESEFNEFSKNNNLNITLSINLLLNINSTSSLTSYGDTADSLLKKNSNKYDIFFYDSLYTQDYEPYLLDFSKYIPKESIEKYNQDILNQLCKYNNRLVGFPARIGYNVLYSNKYLLDKYHKDPPKTWDELISTSKYIIEEEKKENNTNIVAYNGLYNGKLYINKYSIFVFSI
ncbi:hypothetical protein BCR32DRAFT_243145 [Anaeromyces robustus]|uniref:Periplasmic binding protein-like II n=1 Tax=Anaeromyces robustus TaxID=1754192 RepID=A0A1Y1XDD5_9FUNG|nr:hypothetical protein BCR32DRAFT_243145 [Anaeromyces robustus]|eukprot:ORX83749.1 hypothetical protein BCR32DRAFT_243145 [Anaeromyces robustus]